MDEQEQINQIKLTYSRPRTWSDYFDYCQAYSFIFIFLFVSVLSFYAHYNGSDRENIEDPLLGMLALSAFRGLDRPDLNPDSSIVLHDPSEHAEQQSF